MHFSLISLFLLMLINPLSSYQGTEQQKEVAFSSRTRGASELIRLSPDTVFVDKQGLQESYSYKKALSEQDWQKVLDTLQDVKLSSIGELPAPTDQRQRDAAKHSQISITTGSQTYTSSTFDDHNPPKPLQALMKVMEQLSNKK